MKDKEIEMGGCIIVPEHVSQDEVVDKFIAWVESNGWYFGGGFHELTDDKEEEAIS